MQYLALRASVGNAIIAELFVKLNVELVGIKGEIWFAPK